MSPSFIERLNSLRSFTDYWRLLKDVNHSNNPDKAQECYSVADWDVFSCRYKTRYTDGGDNGDKWEYKCKLSNEQISFIKEFRLPYITNPMVRGLYYDVLSAQQGLDVNKQYTYQSLLCYIEAIKNYHSYHDVSLRGMIYSAFVSSKMVNHEGARLRDAVLSFLRNGNDMDIVRLQIFLMLNRHKFISNRDLQDLVDGDEKWLDMASDWYNERKEFLSCLLKLAQSTNKSTEYRNRIFHLLAENEDTILKQHELNAFSVKQILDKIKYLENGDFKDEAQKSRLLLAKAKSIGFGDTSIQIQLAVPNELLDSFELRLEKWQSFFECLAADDNLIPNAPIMSDEEDEFERLGIRTVQIDDNGNPTNKKIKLNNLLLKHINAYKMILSLTIKDSMQKMIMEENFTYDKLIEYLGTTWLALPKVPVNAELRKSNESWLDEMKPSLRIICQEIEKEVTRQEYKGDYVCALDSLTGKIEGSIRDIARRKGLVTVKNNLSENLLGSLLDQMDKIMPKKTVLLLKSVLVDEGLNLRNKYAHGFSSLADYNLENALALLHCVLRISNVPFTDDE